MINFLLRWLISAVALWAATYLIAGITVSSWQTLVPVALIFGVVNATIRPLLKLLTCPLIILTLGLFTLVINALMLQLTAWLSGAFDLGFSVADFWSAFWGALVVSIVSILLSLFVSDRDD